MLKENKDLFERFLHQIYLMKKKYAQNNSNLNLLSVYYEPGTGIDILLISPHFTFKKSCVK